MESLVFKVQKKEELLPFMKEAFKDTLDQSLVFDYDNLTDTNHLKQINNQTLKNQIRLDLGLYIGDKLIGSFMGRSTEKGIFRMGTSVILSEYQGKGNYNQLLQYVVEWAKNKGFLIIESNHNFCNSKIIATKLKKGFYISGTQSTLTYGNMVNLIMFLDPKLEEVYKFRNGFAAPSEFVKGLFSLE